MIKKSMVLLPGIALLTLNACVSTNNAQPSSAVQSKTN